MLSLTHQTILIIMIIIIMIIYLFYASYLEKKKDTKRIELIQKLIDRLNDNSNEV